MDFVKMQGCGNSYLFFDLRSGRRGEDIIKKAPALCHSKLGAGGDGVVLLLPHESSFCAMEIYNADGSRAKICGNALRCAGSLFFESLPFFIHTDI
ncbi:MAG: diaminopimelate epimerase, partial [Oscillospiraceae bacterium]|nr:diaminopimelate epimerase [Oscillospiraceae bacterium]